MFKPKNRLGKLKKNNGEGFQRTYIGRNRVEIARGCLGEGSSKFDNTLRGYDQISARPRDRGPPSNIYARMMTVKLIVGTSPRVTRFILQPLLARSTSIFITRRSCTQIRNPATVTKAIKSLRAKSNIKGPESDFQ